MKQKLKYFIPIFGLIYPCWAKDGLLNDMGDDAFKLAWVFCHFITTVPIMVGLGFMIIFVVG
jgi:hypothetical protein